MDGCMDGWMDGWMDRQTDRQTDRREYWLLKGPDLNFQRKVSTLWVWTFDVRITGLIWVQMFWKGYQQMTKSSKGLTQSQNISVQLVITFKVSNSLDPDKAWTECRSWSWSKLFAKSYQQMTMSCKSLKQSLNISVQLQLVITYKVSNSLDPD